MKKFTVLLLHPDCIADQYGRETYIAWVYAPDPGLAVKQAQHDAAEANGYPEGENDSLSLDDFHPLLVVAGHVIDLTPERWR